MYTQTCDHCGEDTVDVFGVCHNRQCEVYGKPLDDEEDEA